MLVKKNSEEERPLIKPEDLLVCLRQAEEMQKNKRIVNTEKIKERKKEILNPDDYLDDDYEIDEERNRLGRYSWMEGEKKRNEMKTNINGLINNIYQQLGTLMDVLRQEGII